MIWRLDYPGLLSGIFPLLQLEAVPISQQGVNRPTEERENPRIQGYGQAERQSVIAIASAL